MRVYRSKRGSVRTSAAAHESDHLDHSACSKRQMAAATGPVSPVEVPSYCLFVHNWTDLPQYLQLITTYLPGRLPTYLPTTYEYLST